MSLTTKKKHILFDLDGTLSDPSKGIISSLRKTLLELNIPLSPEEDYSWVIGPTIDQAFGKILKTDSVKVIENAVQIFRSHYQEEGLYQNKMYDGVPELLSNLVYSEKKLYIATSKPEKFAHLILAKFQIKHHFTYVCGSLLYGERKSKLDIIKHIMDLHNLYSNDCMMIGDRKFDINSAKELLIDSIGVNYGFAVNDEIEKSQPKYICDDLFSLNKLFLTL